MIRLEKNHHKLVWGTEDWIISAHKNGDNNVVGTNLTLSQYYAQNKDFFGNCKSDVFPLLVKIIDAKDDLSIQVHPDDNYGKKHENSLGKTECWYILDCNDDSDIVVGQKAKNREELLKAINVDEVMDYMNVIDVNKDDFFYIPSGCVHAIRSNTKILEIQQSSDITYRLYDYKRPGIDGNLRELHIDKSLDVIDYNFQLPNNDYVITNDSNNKITTLVNNDFFTVKKIEVDGELKMNGDKYFTMGICMDDLTINDENLKNGETFIEQTKKDIVIKGKGTLFLSTYGG